MKGDQEADIEINQDEFTPINYSEFKHDVCIQVINQVHHVKQTFEN